MWEVYAFERRMDHEDYSTLKWVWKRKLVYSLIRLSGTRKRNCSSGRAPEVFSFRLEVLPVVVFKFFSFFCLMFRIWDNFGSQSHTDMKKFYAILRPSLFEGSAWLKNIAICFNVNVNRQALENSSPNIWLLNNAFKEFFEFCFETFLICISVYTQSVCVSVCT